MADQKIVVRISTESDLKTGIKEVQDLGLAAEKDIKTFNSLSEAIDAGVNDALKEAGVSSKELGAALVKSGRDGTNEYKSLKAQIQAARQAAVEAGIAFGKNSQQALDAQKNVAKLVNEQDQLNKRVAAFNPDAKFQAATQSLQGLLGVFTAGTGILQIFGSENEKINEALRKFQGLINVAQGLTQLGQLKDSFGNLRAVLGITTLAQQSLTQAAAESSDSIEDLVVEGEKGVVQFNNLNTATANAGKIQKALAGTTNAASVSAIELAAAERAAAEGLVEIETAATPLIAALAPVILVTAALLAIVYELTQGLFDEADALEASNKAFKENIKNADAAAESYKDFLGAGEQLVATLSAQGAAESTITAAKIKSLQADINLLATARDRAASAKVATELEQKRFDLSKKLALEEINFAKQVEKEKTSALVKAQAERDRIVASQLGLKKQQFDAEVKLAQDNADEVTILNIKAGEDDKANQIALTKDLLVIYEKFGLDTIALRKKLAELLKREPLVFGPTQADIDAQTAATKKGLEDQAKLQQEHADLVLGIQENAIDLNIQLLDIRRQRIQDNANAEIATETDLLNKKKISQEQYDKKIRAIKNKAAQDDKKLAIFQAFLDLAGAVLKALNTAGGPAARAAAVAYAVALGGLQIAAIESRPVPKFFKGTKFATGGHGGVDDIPAMIHRGEAVIPTETNRLYAPAIDAIFHRKISPSILNNLIHQHRTGKATTATKSLEWDILRATSRNKSVSIRNVDEIADAIYRKQNAHSNIRMQ